MAVRALASGEAPAPSQGLLFSGDRVASMAVSVSLQPSSRCLWDEPVRVSVRGLRPGQAVTLRASLRDESGEPFRCQGRYQADEGGRLELDRSPALGGSFSGLEPMGLIWALEPARPLWRLIKRDVRTPFAVELQVLDGHDPSPGPLLATAVHERAFMAPGVRRIPLRQGRVRATLFLPPGQGPFPGIIDIFGIGGGLFEYRASLLANHGFASLALAYYGFEDLPQDFKEVDLEYFQEAINIMLRQPQVKGPGVGLLGISKGSDLCLSMAAFLKGITATVSINGSAINNHSVLRYKDVRIPPIGYNLRRIRITGLGVLDIVDICNDLLDGPRNPSVLPLERAEGVFLFIVGQDDHNWKSEFYADIASKRLELYGKEKPQILCYPGTGHYIEPPYFPMCPASTHALVRKPVIWGGEPRAHSKAQVDAWRQIQAFFRKHLGMDENAPPPRL